MNLTQDNIINYIEYLQKNHGLEISVHFSKEYNHIIYSSHFDKILNYNFHKNPYCYYIKNIQHKYEMCLEYQHKIIIHKCFEKEHFISECHAGIKSYIQRITLKNNVVGFISVSGYSTHSAVLKNQPYSSNIHREDIPEKLLETVLPPLAVMISEHIKKCPLDSYNDNYIKIINYINHHYNDLTLSDIAKDLSLSKSYISHLFKKKNSCTLKGYCNSLKINDAKDLLLNTDLNVTDISLSAGFNDLSYFINTFKKVTGYTPYKWRQTKRGCSKMHRPHKV